MREFFYCTNIHINVSEEAAMSFLLKLKILNLSKVNQLKLAGNSSKEIVDMIFKNNATATQTTFYP